MNEQRGIKVRPPSPAKVFSNGRIARMRIFVLPNDGGYRPNPESLILSDIKGLIDDATQKLKLVFMARRFFTLEGQEITSLWSIQPKETIVVSEGEDFKPRRKPSKGLSQPGSPAKIRASQHLRRTETKGEALDDIAAYSKNPYLKPKLYDDPREGGGESVGRKKWDAHGSQDRHHAETSIVKEPSRCSSAKRVKRAYVRPNDGGVGKEKAVVEAATLQGFLDSASMQLGLACPLTRLFDMFGREILTLEDVPPGTETVASAGEEFRPIKRMEHCVEEMRLQESRQERSRAGGGRHRRRESPHPRDRHTSRQGRSSDGENSPPTSVEPRLERSRRNRQGSQPREGLGREFRRSVSQEILGQDAARQAWEEDVARLGSSGQLIPADEQVRGELEAGELDPMEVRRLQATLQKQQDALEQTKAKLHMHTIRAQATAQFPSSPTKIHRPLTHARGQQHSIRNPSPSRVRRGTGGPFGTSY